MKGQYLHVVEGRIESFSPPLNNSAKRKLLWALLDFVVFALYGAAQLERKSFQYTPFRCFIRNSSTFGF